MVKLYNCQSRRLREFISTHAWSIFDVLCFEMAPLGLCPCERMRQLFNVRNTKEWFDFFFLSDQCDLCISHDVFAKSQVNNTCKSCSLNDINHTTTYPVSSMYHLRFKITDAAVVLCKFNFSLHLHYDSPQKMERENQLHVIERFRNTNIWMF